MTKIQLDQSLKTKLRVQKKKLEDRWEKERARWSLGVGTALVIGMAIGKLAK